MEKTYLFYSKKNKEVVAIVAANSKLAVQKLNEFCSVHKVRDSGDFVLVSHADLRHVGSCIVE